ncbi:hypothetical protein BDA96_04G255100 [Sorghum bicolor]|jgi:hypothetical protein|uniref:Uncharacterized protein n=2 Tax=Sorghum bicolor TaxID=4558 RepID=A0A194YRF6_SORBI|nr:hypothetical protein BDA96_04G255100 [Sorghum bicolor]KXG30771.1 hypothetical protein SORBI_3004G239700 [Sorghum bicolor]
MPSYILIDDYFLRFVVFGLGVICDLLQVFILQKKPLYLSTEYGYYFYWFHFIYYTFCSGSIMEIYCLVFQEFFPLQTKTMMSVFAMVVGI